MSMMQGASLWFWVVLVGSGVVLAVFVPALQVKWLCTKWKWQMEPKERFDTTNDARKTVAQILGGVAILAGFYFTNRSISVNNPQLELNNRQLKLAEAGQLNDRFATGVKQLGDEKGVVRLGGIQALGEMANLSQEYHWIVMDVVAGFVREKAPWTKKLSDQASHEHFISWRSDLKLPTDIQAAVAIIGLRKREFDRKNYKADLGYSNLRGADFTYFWLDNMEFSGTHFEFTDLTGAHLEGSDLDECHFEHATLRGTNLTGATLEGAILKYTDLSHVKGLDQKQIDSAIGNKGTVLPPEIQRPSEWE